ncbi:NAD(P)-dependent oxidoreductase [Bifidobacterium sp.]|jgi:D-3-phosphoglycerate dehydrogenase|uniref:NAD(P)-dependent oxidoreductase n=1 Tax=Bifidobacterium sp. TaxID=41200 RepID=UPI0025BE8FA0|nr:NAD(P)-dependent oxidoreductase [Bifidobacterium sp.]MCH4209978.1 hypothetical protein [Bifidobacterium sp.]MCI1225549.1 hypothetical protein [Bifidobacterium sp.]
MKIVVVEPLSISVEEFERDAHELLQDDEIVRYASRPKNDAECIDRVEDADVIVVANLPLNASVLSHCGHLKMVSIAFVGYDHVDVDYCRDHNIAVTNAPTYPTEAVAELAIGLTLSVLRKIPQGDRAVRSSGTSAGLVGGQLAGKVFGIVGMGRIGRATAMLAQAFGATTIGFNRSPRDVPGIRQVDLSQLLRTADIVSLHVPLTDGTRHLIGAEQLALMKPGAIIINTARGQIIDNDALADALSAGRLAGAGLDVFDTEPPVNPDNRILHAPNTVLTPHVGFDTGEALTARALEALGNIGDWQSGNDRNRV